MRRRRRGAARQPRACPMAGFAGFASFRPDRNGGRLGARSTNPASQPTGRFEMPGRLIAGFAAGLGLAATGTAATAATAAHTHTAAAPKPLVVILAHTRGPVTPTTNPNRDV